MKEVFRHRSRIIAALAGAIFLLIPGVFIGQLPPPSFNHLKRDIDLFSSNYFTIAEDPYGFIWFGSHGGGGLYRFDGYDLVSFQADANRLHETISGSRITSIYFGPDSLLYIGTSFGFTIMDPVTGEVRNFNNILDSLPNSRLGSTLSFLSDTARQILWIGTKYGLAKMDMKDYRFTTLRPVTPIHHRMPDDISDIVLDQHADHLWLGTYQGLFKYDIQNGVYDYIENDVDREQEIPVYKLYQDPSATLWITSGTGHLFRFHPSSNTWNSFPIDDPSPDRKDVYGIIPVNESECWLSSRSTVGRLNLNNGKYEFWQHDAAYPDGLLHNGDFRDLIGDRHGRLWVASWHGIQYAKRAFVPPSRKATGIKVAITSVDIVPVIEEKKSPLLYTQPLFLERSQRDITFHYVLPNPLDPGRVEYQYMLKGNDDDWITTDQRSVRYSHLNGGDYVFMVRGREVDESEWLPETLVELHIDKRISELWWFWSGLILVAGLIAVVIYRWLLSKARQQDRMKSEFENKLSEIQMQALRAQMNPHFLFNSLNSIKYFALTKSKDDTASFLSKFALLVRSILNNSKSRTISLKDELDALKLYIEIEHLRLEGKFDYKIEIDNSIHIGQAQIPPMILQPYVENAIWHGLMHKEGKGFLLVQVKDMGRQIQCIIEDNGIGRLRAAEIRAAGAAHKASVGMQITSDRINLINKIYNIDTKVDIVDLSDGNGQPCGTRVIVHIPLIRDEEE